MNMLSIYLATMNTSKSPPLCCCVFTAYSLLFAYLDSGLDSEQANEIVPAPGSIECGIAISLASIQCLRLMMSS